MGVQEAGPGNWSGFFFYGIERSLDQQLLVKLQIDLSLMGESLVELSPSEDLGILGLL